MRLKNVLIIVRDIERSKAFYRDLFEMNIVTDFGKNVILTEGLVLQEHTLWETSIGKEVQTGGNDKELYFEEYDFDGFLKKLSDSRYPIEYVTEPESERSKHSRRVVRIYDPDRHIIEVAEKDMPDRK